jgi:hypothetical protein
VRNHRSPLFLLLLCLCAKPECQPTFAGACEEEGGGVKLSVLVGESGDWEIEGNVEADLPFDLAAAEVKPSLLWSCGSARGIFGTGSLGKGLAFRKSPYARPKSSESPPWSSDGSDQIVGFKAGPLSLVWEASLAAETAGDAGDPASGRRDAQLMWSPRLAVLELEAVGKGVPTLAAAFQMSRLPEKEPASGWRPGSGDRLSQTFLGFSLSAEFKAGDAKMGIWSSGIFGSLAHPSLAASLQVDTGRFVLGRLGPESVKARLSAFAYASLEKYLDVEGKKPAWDRLLDASLELGSEGWSLELGMLSYSRNSDSSDGASLRLPKPGASNLEILLWRWRTDLISCALSSRLGPLQASIKAKADEEGLASGSAAVKFNLPHKEGRCSWSLGCEARFGRSGASEADSSADEDPDEDAELASGAGLISLTRIGLGMDLGWRDSGGFLKRRSASLTFFVARVDGAWEPASEFVLNIGLRLGKRLQAALKVSSPSGGYSLARLPDELPSISLGFGLGRELF